MVVASFRSAAEARVALSAVEAAGIRATLVNEPTLGAGVVVAAEDVDRAVEVLRGLWPEGDSETDPAAEAPVVEIEQCPDCGSTDLIRIRRLPFFILFSTVMLAIGYLAGQRDLFLLLIAVVAVMLFIGPNRACLRCGERWRSWTSPPPPQRLPEAATELPDVACPRCGAPETARIDRRRMKAMTLLVHFVLPPLLLLWPWMPIRKCEECGHEFR